MMKFFRFRTNKKQQPTSKEEARKDVSHAAVFERERIEKERKRDDIWNMAYESPRLGNVPKQSQGEQIAAGWPEWLTQVAGEALKGWLPRRANSFEKIDKIGQGTYSNVYKARDLESGQVVALKKVRFDNMEPESVRFMAREIKILRRLDHPNVVKLEGLVTSRMSCSLYLVFEFLDHDLVGITSSPNVIFTEAQVKCYLLQILKGLEHCHNRGVLHRDIKGSNLLLDKEGNLKIADFGLATFFQPNKRQQMTTRVVTLWYRPPELLLGATEYGTAIDIWSVGCILGELFAGRPILPGRTEVEQLHKIFKLCGSPPEEYWKKYKLSHATIFKPQHPYKRVLTETYKDFPQTGLDLLDVMLALDPDDRGTASSALQSDFFNTKPFACEPSSLPKYVSSKSDGKGRDEKGRRQRGAETREFDASKRESILENPRNAAGAQEGKELNLNNEKLFSYTQSAKSKSERFRAKDVAMKLSSDVSRQHQQEGGRNQVYALPPDPVQQETALDNISWAGLLDRKPREEGLNVVRTRPPLSRSVRHTTALPDLAPGNHGTQKQGGGLSKLSTLVATRSSRSQESRYESFEASSNERSSERSGKVGTDASTEGLKPIRWTKGLHGFDVQEDVDYDRNKKLGLRGSAPRIPFSGPLLPPSANVEHIMHEHDRQIQKVFRRTRQERDKNRQNGELQVFGGRGANESFEASRGTGANESVKGSGSRNSYEPSMANNSQSKYRPGIPREFNKLIKGKKDKDSVFETYDYQHELEYF